MGSRRGDRHILHCLRCFKPQQSLPVHLTRTCMKHCTLAERAEEVKKAKIATKTWILKSRVWDYGLLNGLLPHLPCKIAMVKALESRGTFVINKPHNWAELVASTPPDSATPTLATASIPEAAGPRASSPSSTESNSSGEPTRQSESEHHGGTSKSVRMRMKEAGMYAKFPDRAPLIRDFKKYLKVSLKVRNCQEEVDNVNRFLKFVQDGGDEPTTAFLTLSTETKNFFASLESCGLQPASVHYYMKSIMWFVQFLQTRLDPGDQVERNKCQAFTDMVRNLRKQGSKADTQGLVRKRFEQFDAGNPTVYQCQKILRVAKADFLNSFRKLLSESPLAIHEKTFYRYYLQALLVLKHFRRPVSVEVMTVKEWGMRKTVDKRVVVAVTEPQDKLVYFALTDEEEAWFQAYYEKIRSQLVEEKDCQRFFVSSRGTRVSKVISDLSRLHEHYKIQPVITSQTVRTALRTEAGANFTAEQQESVDQYLAHPTTFINEYSRMSQPEQVIATAIIMDTLGSISPPTSTTNPPASTRDTFDDFVAAFPVTVESEVPSKRRRLAQGFDTPSFYDRWRYQQYTMRLESILTHFSYQKPSLAEVARLIKKKGWSINCPKAADVVEKWKPPTAAASQTDKKLKRCVVAQKWKGLSLRDFGGDKGQGVIADRRFLKGEIVCDYHGKVITGAEGREKMGGTNGRASHLFFFQDGQRDLCMDAQADRCDCHPDKETLGRKINHSSKKPNLKHVHVVMRIAEEDRHVILFRAMEDIDIGTELKCDYGVNRGECRDMKFKLHLLKRGTHK
ncbi:uncharacterized protein LOC121513846 isoform X2 [Cheilinus undulatus]|uniref:uncharacterized protein LOC121513846 isoform X2 n=1 Tax=Cheilinus undulatus TaxID=241271 RepID=UPI001BD20B74|nr:uncharacterized protein LOC121513846 isoform X2 [Cheilinus undulatus]